MRTQRRLAKFAAALTLAATAAAGISGIAAAAPDDEVPLVAPSYEQLMAQLFPGWVPAADEVEVAGAEEVTVAGAAAADIAPSSYVPYGVNYDFYASLGYGRWMADAMAALRHCESTDNYAINSGNGYYGAYQFSASTWWWLGYEGYPHNAPPQVQDEAALALYEINGWSPWPGCSWWLGL